MASSVRTKICGLSRPEEITAAVDAGAAYIGFVFFEKSPRYVTPETAAALAADVPPGVAKVALLVNPDDAYLDAILDVVPIDLLQLHGKESPERVAQIRARTGLPVMKAIGVADEADLLAVAPYAAVSDMLLVDAKPPKDGTLPGGNGVAFDWRLVSGQHWPVPWMLAGGLSPENVAEAIQLTGASQVDVSSGVESAPGQKDLGKVAAFLHAAAET